MLATHPRGEERMRKVLAMLVVLSLVMSMFTGVFAPVPEAKAAVGPSITVFKNTVGGDGTFHFTVSGGVYGVSEFDITTGTTTVGQGIYSVPVTAGVAYTVTEGTEPAGWVSADVYMVQTATVPTDGTVATAVYFNNTAMGTLEVIKHTTGGDGTFDFTVSGGVYDVSPFDITTDGGIGSYTVPVIAGSYTVTEGTLPAGWVATGDTAKDVVVPLNGTGTATFTNNITPTPPVVTPPVVTPPVVTPPVVTPPVVTPTTVYHQTFFIGYPDGTFKPDRNVSRAEVAAALTRALGLGWSDIKPSYPDVSATHWSSGNIQIMKDEGIMIGDTSGTFRPDAFITRAEAATLVLRMLKIAPIQNLVASSFPDVPVTYWAAGYIEAMQKNGLITGYPDGTYKPTANILRSEFAALANRALGRGIGSSSQTAGLAASVHWPDVPATYWAYLDILEASTPHTVVNAVKLNRTIVLKTKTIPLFSDGASTVTIHKVGDVLTAIVPVDGLLPNGSLPAARQVTVVITIKLKP